jgi:hypothetical protein
LSTIHDIAPRDCVAVARLGDDLAIALYGGPAMDTDVAAAGKLLVAAAP